jgi:CO/xanthine dehydrogenase FAD-binding subunit
MITIEEYVKPKSAGEAYSLLTGSENASVIGGGLFLRLGSKKIGLAIDLSEAGLDFIRDIGENIEIGAMTTFGDLEKSPLLKDAFDGVIPKAVSGIVGTQFKNMATVGGTVYSRLGFSELITALLTLDCRLVLLGRGEIRLTDFMEGDAKGRDLLEKIVLKKADIKASFQPFKLTAGSLPILAVAASKGPDGYAIAVGARPGAPALAKQAMAFMDSSAAPDAAEKAADIAAGELDFKSDRRASGEYRRELSRVLVKRALTEVL